MVIKPTSWDDTPQPKENLEEPPEPMKVPIIKINEFDVETVGTIMSNTNLGLDRYQMFAKYPMFLGIAFISELNQYVLITTSRNKGIWEQENEARVVTDEAAFEFIMEQGKEKLLEEDEFSRLKKYRDGWKRPVYK